MLSPNVYLCGGINGLSDADANGWRELAKRRLPRTLDPMRRDYRGREAANVNEIVHGDLDDIDQCDFVLAMCNRPSWGTAMEIFYAHSQGKRVLAVVEEYGERRQVSPWLAYHSTVYPTLDAAIDAIEELCR